MSNYLHIDLLHIRHIPREIVMMALLQELNQFNFHFRCQICTNVDDLIMLFFFHLTPFLLSTCHYLLLLRWSQTFVIVTSHHSLAYHFLNIASLSMKLIIPYCFDTFVQGEFYHVMIGGWENHYLVDSWSFKDIIVSRFCINYHHFGIH